MSKSAPLHDSFKRVSNTVMRLWLELELGPADEFYRIYHQDPKMTVQLDELLRHLNEVKDRAIALYKSTGGTQQPNSFGILCEPEQDNYQAPMAPIEDTACPPQEGKSK